MNLSDCKTIEEYREAAHYWQKKWKDNEDEIQTFGLIIRSAISILKNHYRGTPACLEYLQETKYVNKT